MSRRKQSAMGSSKYEFELEEFEKDVKDKKEVQRKFKNDLKEVLYKEYEYRDGTHMSNRAKREILIEIHTEFIEEGKHD